MADTEYESILMVKPEVFVFQLPPRASNRGYRAADWSLTKPSWTGRMRIVAKGRQCFIKLEDNSGELFAACPVDKYPGGLSVEAVTDSSRYFVLKLVNESGQHAFIGIGFADRSDSFDFNVSLQEHFRWIKTNDNIQQENLTEQPKLDLSLKEGQTIHINLKSRKDVDVATGRKPTTGFGQHASGGLLPPPPGGKGHLLPTPPSSAQTNPPVKMQPQSNEQLINFAASGAAHQSQQETEWTSFESFGQQTANPTNPTPPKNWETF